jgi:hypothetical protein
MMKSDTKQKWSRPMQAFWALLSIFCVGLATALFCLGAALPESRWLCIIQGTVCLGLAFWICVVLKRPNVFLDENGRARSAFRK